MKKIVIAIDGYSSCGKSTLANQLAKELNYVFVDSGAMYRAITLYFLNHQVDFSKEENIVNALKKIHLEFIYDREKQQSFIFLNGKNVEDDIREMNINQNVSKVAALKLVREFAVAKQQQMGLKKAIVMDGRDIGTTVFPNAELKVFVTADVDTRVERRFKELQEKGIETTKEVVKKNLEERDFIDSNRDFSPLRKASDALILDNTLLNRDEQLLLVLKWVNNIINN